MKNLSKIPELICINLDIEGRPFIVDTTGGNCHISISYVHVGSLEKYAFNDKIEDGQKRWVYWRNSWSLAEVYKKKDGVVFSVGNHYAGASFSLDDPELIEVGPVVRAPKYKPDV